MGKDRLAAVDDEEWRVASDSIHSGVESKLEEREIEIPAIIAGGEAVAKKDRAQSGMPPFDEADGAVMVGSRGLNGNSKASVQRRKCLRNKD